jgi:hypothetical protein
MIPWCGPWMLVVGVARYKLFAVSLELVSGWNSTNCVENCKFLGRG